MRHAENTLENELHVADNYISQHNPVQVYNPGIAYDHNS